MGAETHTKKFALFWYMFFVKMKINNDNKNNFLILTSIFPHMLNLGYIYSNSERSVSLTAMNRVHLNYNNG